MLILNHIPIDVENQNLLILPVRTVEISANKWLWRAIFRDVRPLYSELSDKKYTKWTANPKTMHHFLGKLFVDYKYLLCVIPDFILDLLIDDAESYVFSVKYR